MRHRLSIEVCRLCNPESWLPAVRGARMMFEYIRDTKENMRIFGFVLLGFWIIAAILGTWIAMRRSTAQT